MVTRAANQASDLVEGLGTLGADVLLLPMIQIIAPEDAEPLSRAAAECNRFDWIIFTSTNAVEAFVAAVPPEFSVLAKIATVGESTRRACEKHGLTVALTPEQYVAEALVEAFAVEDLQGQRVLIPSAAVTRDVVAGALRDRGALVDVVQAYRNAAPPDADAMARDLLREPFPDWILFASSSAVTNLVGLTGVDTMNRMRIATIGPATSATAVRLGLRVATEARRHDSQGLIDALLNAQL